MTSDTSGFDVEVQALVAFGTERYEDAVTCSAIRRYLDDIGAVPDAAWGTLEVSDQLRRGWATALSSRVSEALNANAELERMADGLLQIAADYQGTDMEIATTFDIANQDLQLYLPGGSGYTDEIRIRRGGSGITTPPAAGRPEPGSFTASIPSDNGPLTATRNEVLPSTRAVDEPIEIGTTDGNDFAFSGGRTTYYDNGSGDQLDRFIQEHHDTLLQMEALLTQLGTGQRLPLSDLMIHAWRSSPAVIRNRADLIHSVANTYGEVGDEMSGELARLKLYWEGPAFDSFHQYGTATVTYLTDIAAQASWLAEEGKKAASLLEGLRNAYASTGYERIAGLIEAYKAYVTRVRGLFESCTNPEKAFLDAMGLFVDFLLDSEKRHVEQLAALVRIDEQERKERPDLSSRGHDVVPFPQNAVGPDSWDSTGEWRGRANKPSR